MWAMWAAAALAAPLCGGAADRVEVHLASVAPGPDLFSSMGHTALVFEGGDLVEPVSYDWGVFQERPDMLALFLAGELPYFLNEQPWEYLRSRADARGRTIVLQRVDVPADEAAALLAAVQEEARPENREYVYRWDTANCATRARDALDRASGGALRRALDRPVPDTARSEATRHLAAWPVPLFAWRFVTSAYVDAPLTAWERAMVPERLAEGLSEAGRVAQRCELPAPRGWAPSASPWATWGWSAPGLVGAVAVVSAGRRRRVVGGLVALYGAVLALLGTAGLVVWLASDLPGVGPTVNWLVAGPQTWLLVGVGIAVWRGRASAWATTVAWALAGLGAVAAGVGIVPGGQVNADIVAALWPGLVACAVAVGRCGRPESAR